MKKFILMILIMFVVSMFYFPILFTFFPVQNTKNLLGAFGLLVIVILLIKTRSIDVPWPVITVIILAGVMSLVSLFSIIFNHTQDTAYVTYITSMLIWLSGAFACCVMIRLLHGYIDVPLLTKYIVAVCVYQCAMALLIDGNMAVRSFVDRYVEQGQALLQDMDRLYGVGASLDVAGTRFSVALIMLTKLILDDKRTKGSWIMVLYVLCYLFIFAVGSMIARTTYVGLAMSFGLFVLNKQSWNFREVHYSSLRLIGVIVGVITFLVILGVYLYNTSAQFHRLFRFAFEGFFNLFENGTYQVDSTSKLQTMYVWPDNLKTWIIGDGYFSNPRSDINYLGHTTTRGYYMGTDVGYCRFIFYCGTIGLLAITAVYAYMANACAKIKREYAVMMFFIFMANMVIWLKVATDVLPILALMLCTCCMEQVAQTKNDIGLMEIE